MSRLSLTVTASFAKMSTALSEILAIHALDENDLRRTLSKEHREELTKRIENWKAVGAALGFDQDHLDLIDQANNLKDVQHKKTNLFVQWIVRHRDEATYLKLAKQLFTGERMDLLKDLCGILASDTSTNPSSALSGPLRYNG